MNENESAYQEPQFQSTGPPLIYSLQMRQTGPQPMVTVHNNEMGNGATVDTWRSTTEAEFPAAEYLLTNQLWEFIPAAVNPGGTLQSTWNGPHQAAARAVGSGSACTTTSEVTARVRHT